LCVMLTATQFSATRSAVAVSSLTILAFLLISRDLRPSLRLLAVLTLGGLPALYWFGPPAGWSRWLDLANISTNADLRLRSNVVSLQLSIEHPIGLGVQAQLEALQYAWLGSAHNAFLGVAVQYGLLFAVIVALSMLLLALQARPGLQTGRALETLLTIHLLGLFFFEEHLYSSTFIALTSWIFVAGSMRVVRALGLLRTTRQGPTLPKTPSSVMSPDVYSAVTSKTASINHRR
jgi:hypothetical protein